MAASAPVVPVSSSGSWERVSPIGLTVETVVAVPVALGVVGGALSFLAVLFALWFLGYGGSRVWSGAALMGTVGAILFVAYGLMMVDESRWVVERSIADPVRIAPAVATTSSSVEVEEEDEEEGEVVQAGALQVLEVIIPGEGSSTIKRIRFGVGEEKLRQFAAGVVAGRTLGQRDWAGPERLFTVGEFQRLRGELLERGFVEWRSPGNPAQGVQPTEQGRALFETLAGPSVAPMAA